MLSETDKAYLAGIVDGEGSISITTPSKYNPFRLVMKITNNNMDLLQGLKDLWGGNITVDSKGGNSNPTGRLWFTPGVAPRILKEIQPFLKIKREHCAIALRFAETVSRHNSRPLSLELLKYRQDLKSQIKRLNRRGIQ